MAYEFYYHPLSSFCQKAMIAFCEADADYVPMLLEHQKPETMDALRALWPVGKFPVLRDTESGRVVPEATIIVEYLAQHVPGAAHLVPSDPDLAREVRLQDRFFDLHISVPVQKIVGNRLRPENAKDPLGVKEARTALRTAYGILDDRMATRRWAMGEAFTMADCAAAPALFYADMQQPLGEAFPHAASYLERLKARPSYARVLKDAAPYLHMVPKD